MTSRLRQDRADSRFSGWAKSSTRAANWLHAWTKKILIQHPWNSRVGFYSLLYWYKCGQMFDLELVSVHFYIRRGCVNIISKCTQISEWAVREEQTYFLELSTCYTTVFSGKTQTNTLRPGKGHVPLPLLARRHVPLACPPDSLGWCWSSAGTGPWSLPAQYPAPPQGPPVGMQRRAETGRCQPALPRSGNTAQTKKHTACITFYSSSMTSMVKY